jgi:hypothetical protein
MLPIILAAAPALAQPAPMAPPPMPAPAPAPGPTAGGPCNVNIVRAPDPVRQTIERWLANEHCTLALQVRIIPTEGGLYVLATDDHGRVRERIVPDAASAGVLIASWAADDGLGGAAPPPGIADAGGPPVAPPAAPPPMGPPAGGYGPPAAGYGPSYGNGGAYGGPPPSFNSMSFRAPGQYSPNDELPPPPEAQHPAKLLALSAGFGANSSGGLRLELELWNRSNWIIGASAGLTGSQMSVDDYYGSNSYYNASVTDFTLAVTLGRIARWGDWYMRGNVGVGLMISSLTLDQYDYQSYMDTSGSGSETSPYIEAGLFVGHSIGSSKQWEIEAGPVLSYSKQDWYLTNTNTTMYRDAGNAMFMLGLRHGL